MTKKDYETIASEIRWHVEEVCQTNDERGLFYSLVIGLAARFQSDNPRFDEARFTDACGFGLQA